MRVAQRFTGLPIPSRVRGVVELYDVSDDWIPIYDKSDLPGFYMAVGTSGNQFKNAPVVGEMMAALIEACEAGRDHDSDPLGLPSPAYRPDGQHGLLFAAAGDRYPQQLLGAGVRCRRHPSSPFRHGRAVPAIHVVGREDAGKDVRAVSLAASRSGTAARPDVDGRDKPGHDGRGKTRARDDMTSWS